MMVKIAILVLVIICIFYRCTNDFNFDLIEIMSWEYSTEKKYYVVEFKWTNSSELLQGFLISDEQPLEGERYLVAGYDMSKGMWHIVKKK